MSNEKKLKYRIAVKYESNHPIEAHSPEEAIQQWQREFKIGEQLADIGAVGGIAGAGQRIDLRFAEAVFFEAGESADLPG